MILIPQYRTARRSAYRWSPAELFASSETGFWLDPSDLSTVWQDTAGTTSAAVGDPVARIDDKSGNGNNALQATEANRPILRQDADGAYYLEFDGSNDGLTVTAAMGTQVLACTPVLLTAGSTKIVYDGITSGDRMSLIRDGAIDYALLWTGPVSSRVNYSPGVSKENVMVQFNGASSVFHSQAGRSNISFGAGSPTGISIGKGFDGSFAVAARVYGAIFLSRVATLEERLLLDTWVRDNWLLDSGLNAIVCDGNSLTKGIGTSSTNHSYPAQLLGLLGTGHKIVNAGIASQQTTAMTAKAADQIDPFINWPAGGSVLIAWENTNDINAGASLATCQTRWNDYFSARQAAGWGSNGTRLVAMTTIARGPFDSTQDAIVADFNTWLRANYATYATDLVDLAADSRLSDPTNTTYFATDQIHLKQAGYAVVAELVHAVLTT